MTKQILFIHGGGEGSYNEDKALVDYLKGVLDSQYVLRFPKFDGLENIDYEAWKNQARSEVNKVKDGDVIVAHSLGGAALLKYLSEESHAPSVSGLFLIATPYKVKDGEWGTDDFAVEVDFSSSLPAIQKIFMYHSKDDEWVPVAHLNLWAEKIPHSIVRQTDGQGHSFTNVDFVELVRDIQSL